MKHQGFMLIDVVMYAALSVLFSLLILSFFQRTSDGIRSIDQRLRSFVANTVVLDVLRRELYALDSRASVHDWQHAVYRVQTLDPKCNQQEFYIGWCMHERGLLRIQGQYCPQTATWGTKTETLLLCSLKKLQLTPQLSDDKKNVIRVVVHLEQVVRGQKPCAFDDNVVVRNGVLT